MMQIKVLFILVALLISLPLQAQSVLEGTAKAMVPGTWAVLNQEGDGSGYGYTLTTSGVGIGGLYTYSSEATYDPAHKRVFSLAQGHDGGAGAEIKFNVYDIGTNLWTRLTTPVWAVPSLGNGHAYQMQTMEPGRYVRMWPATYKVFACDIDKADLTDIGGSNCPGDYPDPALTPTLGTVNRGPLEFFPERNSTFFIDSSGSYSIYEKPLNGDWRLFPSTSGLSGDGTYSAYNPVHKVLIFGGGATGSTVPIKRWWKIDAQGVLTRLDDAPVDNAAARFAVDPVSGNGILIRPNLNAAPTGWLFYELDITKPAGEQWRRRQDLEPTIPQFYITNYQFVATVLIPIPDAGVIMFMGYNRVWLYKHGTVPGAPPPPPPPPPDDPPPPTSAMTFAEKCALAGVLGCWGFDDESELRYVWDRNNAAMNTAMAGKTWHSLGSQRNRGEGNTVATGQHVSGALTIPAIDRVTKATGTGSLKFTVPSQTGDQSGYFQDNFNKILGNPSYYVSPTSPNGNTIYMQFRMRVNDVMLDTSFREADLVQNLTTPAAGSDILNANYAAFDAGMVGRMFALTGGNFVRGFYTIRTLLSSSSVQIDRSPTPTASGIGGYAEIPSGLLAGGWKVVILFGNSPDGGSSSGLQVVMNDGYQRNFPTMYGQSGTDSPDIPNRTVPFLRNQFQEITIRVQVLGATNDRTSRVTWWRDGILAGDWTTAKVAWGTGDGDGFGQFQLVPFHTRKDPTQVHDTGYMWFDDVIASTQPIPVSIVAPPQPPPPPVNMAPVSNAGPDQSITLPAPINLVGSATDDGLPSETLTYQWIGPSGVMLSSPGELMARATPPGAGTYTFTLTASDGLLTSLPDSVVVTVAPAPPPPPPSDTTAPTARITYPVTGSTFNGGTVTFYVTATDVGIAGNIVKVELYKEGIAIPVDTLALPALPDSNPLRWGPRVAPSRGSAHRFYAKAYDKSGNVGTSTTITVTRN